MDSKETMDRERTGDILKQKEGKQDNGRRSKMIETEHTISDQSESSRDNLILSVV